MRGQKLSRDFNCCQIPPLNIQPWAREAACQQTPEQLKTTCSSENSSCNSEYPHEVSKISVFFDLVLPAAFLQGSPSTFMLPPPMTHYPSLCLHYPAMTVASARKSMAQILV